MAVFESLARFRSAHHKFNLQMISAVTAEPEDHEWSARIGFDGERPDQVNSLEQIILRRSKDRRLVKSKTSSCQPPYDRATRPID
jgi:hypothetical protein